MAAPIDSKDRGVVSLFARLALGVLLLGEGLARLIGHALPPVPEGAVVFFPPIGALSAVIAAVYAIAGAALVLGIRPRIAATVASSAALALLVAWERIDPVHNETTHLLPVLLLSLAVLGLDGDRYGLRPDARDEPRIDRVVLLSRLFLGAIFFAQGVGDTFGKGGLLGFAEEVYVKPFATSPLPGPALWVAGVTNPLLQMATAILLIAGWKTRLAAGAVAAFLLTILLGHMLSDPLDAAGDLHAYALANLLLALVILRFAPRGNELSVDAWRARRQIASHPGG